jgi:arylsulfatase A-like enzyme
MIAAAFAGEARAEVVRQWDTGFAIRHVVEAPVRADRAYAALGEVGRWWSSAHTYSGDAPKALTLEMKPGGCFCEALAGGGVAHGTVVLAWPAQGMLRLDAALDVFLDRLAQIPGGVLVVLTADHGGSDFVERLHDHGYPHARRADMAAIQGVNDALKARFNLSADPLQVGGSGLMVADAEHRSLPDPLRTQVAEAAVELLRALPDVAFAETRDRLLAEPLPDSRQPEMMSLRERMRLSTVPERSPDIQFAWAQYVTTGGRGGSTLAGHGTPWEYDRRVPILFWWPGATAEERFLPIRTIDIAPTLAHVIGVATPKVEGRCIDLNGFAVADCPTE